MPLNFLIYEKQQKEVWYDMPSSHGHCGIKSVTELMDEFSTKLMQEETFKRNHGKNHLLIASDWIIRYNESIRFPESVYQMLKNITLGNYESKQHTLISIFNSPERTLEVTDFWRCSLIVPYVEKEPSVLSDLVEYSWENWQQREIDLLFMGRFWYERYSYRFRYFLSQQIEQTFARLAVEQKTRLPTYIFGATSKLHYTVDPDSNYLAYKFNSPPNFPPTPLCKCQNFNCSFCQLTPTQQKNYEFYNLKTKFGLIIRGDTSTTSRLYDAIANDQIPIVLSNLIKQEGLPFVDRVRYEDFCFFVDTENVNSALTQIFEILHLPDHVLKEKYNNLQKYKQDLSWLHPKSRVAENLIIETFEKCL